MERGEHLRELFEEYVARRLEEAACEPAELCRDEPELLPELLRLIERLEEVDEALGAGWADVGTPSVAGPSVAEDPSPPAISDYRLLHRLGRGGMGEVWEAIQEAPVRRRVAVKVIRPGFDGTDVLARFAAERQALALMSHVNIARVFDAGRTEDGRPYFAMELVAGEPVTAFCDQHELSLPERLALFGRVCDAVHHAHQRGILHRDLKPSNILVDDDGVPKVIDFGIAKAMGEKLDGATVVTQLGQFMGTPEYMSPEQANPLLLDVDVRADVYSLGVILYELLVGERPWSALSEGDSTESHFERLRTADPPTPSERLQRLGESAAELASRRSTSAARLARTLRGELDWITVKALEPDRERRYGSAAELAEDLDRYRRHEPILAGPPSRLYRLRKYVRRHRVAVMAAALFAVAILGTAGGLGIGLVRALRAERLASREAATARQVAGFVVDLFEVTDPAVAKGDELSARKILEEGRNRLEEELADQPLVRARLLQTIGDIHRKLGLFDEARGLFEESLATRERLLGSESAEVASTLVGLAKVETETGSLRRAELRLARALGIYETTTGADSVEVGRTLHELSSVVRQAGRYREAEALERRSLELLERALGPRHADLAPGLDNLGSIHFRTGRLAEAEEAYRRALAIDEETLGQEHLNVASTLVNLGLVLRRSGRLDEAEPLLRRSLAIHRQALGDEHPSVANGLQSLAGLHARRGSFAEAEALFERALEIHSRVLGRDHPKATTVLKNLGLTSLLQGKLTAAERYLEEALAADERRQGREHIAVIWDLNSLGDVALQRGRTEAAARRFRDALARADSSLGGAHPQRARSLIGLGRVAQEEGRHQEAERIYRQALAMQEASLGRDDPEVAGTLNFLGESLTLQGELGEAEQRLRRALAFQEETLGPQHWQVAPTLVRLADVLLARGDDEPAEVHLGRALEITETALGAEHPQLAQVHEGLGRLWVERQDERMAERHLKRAYDIRRRRLGEEHPLTEDTRRQLSELRGGVGTD